MYETAFPAYNLNILTAFDLLQLEKKVIYLYLLKTQLSFTGLIPSRGK